MEFEFKATISTAMAIMKRWNIVLMESIAANCGDPEQMNYIGKVLHKRVSDTPDGRLTKSFRKRSQSTKEKHNDSVKRSGSFTNTRSATLRPGMMNSGLHLQSENNSPKKLSQHSNVSKFSGEMGDSAKPSRMQSSPPPLPPRPILDCSSSDEDSDYAYIEENEVEGPKGSSRPPSQEQDNGDATERTLDQKLEELELSIKRERKEKKRKAAQEKKKALTVAARPCQPRSPLHLDSKVPFAAADPEDYLEPLSISNSTRPRSTGDYETPVLLHNRSCSEPDNSLCRDSNSLSQPAIHTLRNSPRNSPPRLSPTPEHTAPPPLPSRCWQGKDSVSSQNANDPNISPYAVVRQILPGKILEKHNTSTGSVKPSDAQQKPSSTSQEPRRLTMDVPCERPSGDSPTASTPPSANATVDTLPDTDAPPIPPRSPIKEKLSWNSRNSSTSSVASNHSHMSGHVHAAGIRCSKCLRQRRAPVDKTLSEHGIQPVPQSMPPSHLEKSSLPDLNTTAGVPENTLQLRRQRVHRGRLTSATESRSSSDGSTSSLQSQGNANYLELVPTTPSTGSKGPNDGDIVLDDLLQCIDNKFNSLTQPSSSTQPSSHSLSQANGYGPTRRMNGAKDPPPFLRSQTAAAFINHTPTPPAMHPLNPNKIFSSASMRVPPPPVPPRSDISLVQSGRQLHFPSNHPPIHAANYHVRPWARTSSSGSFTSTNGDSRSPPTPCGVRTRQSSSSSVHSGTPSPTIGPAPHPRSLQHLARHFTHVPDTEGSSTVFIHHLKHDRRVMHSHMV